MEVCLGDVVVVNNQMIINVGFVEKALQCLVWRIVAHYTSYETWSTEEVW